MTAQLPPVVAVGASAGGVEALREFVARVPDDIPACILVVLHVPPSSPSALPAILRRVSTLPVVEARDGDELRPGTVVVAPPNRHLLVAGHRIALGAGPQENGHRPAVDVLFRSAARAAGDRVLAAVLSGTLDDGAAGAVTVAAAGGMVVVQDLQEGLYSGMPLATLRSVPAAVQAPVGGIGKLAGDWAQQLPAWEASIDSPPSTQDQEVDVARLSPEALHGEDRPGVPAGFGCPDCAGALFQIDEGTLRRYRCRVGHAWSPESLLDRQAVEMESALWMALRSLEEKAALNTSLARRADGGQHDLVVRRFEEGAHEASRAAELVRQLIGDLSEQPEQPSQA